MFVTDTLRSGGAGKRGILNRLHASFICAVERSRSRGALAELNDYMLKDIGITREQACRESRRHFWD